MTSPPTVELIDDRSSDGDTPDPCPPAEELAGLLAAVLAAEGVGQGAEAGIRLVDPARMEELNAAHMGVDGPTDVLSFPIDGVGEGPGWLVGDVVVCPEVAAAQAADHAGEAADELRLLVVHGGLHLCGWDHATPLERDRMWRRESELMAGLGVLPTADPWTSHGEPDHGGRGAER